MDEIKLINATRITTSTFDNVSTNLTTQQMASNVSFKGQLVKVFSRDTVCHSGTIQFESGKKHVPLFLLTIWFLALLFGVLFIIYWFLNLVYAMSLLILQAQLQTTLKDIVQKVDEIDLKIQMKDMKIKMNKIEMEVDNLEGSVDEKLT